jgi:hypothetical protein
MLPEEILSQVEQFIKDEMKKNRAVQGKFDEQNYGLYRVLKKMQELDPTITGVGATWKEHEENGLDV